jgi:hypothetical protein
MQRRLRLRGTALATMAAALVAAAPLAHGASYTVRVTIENLAPVNGTYITPLWVGFHDGAFDFFDQGSAPSTTLESLAEDGNTDPISADFTAHGGLVQGTIPGLVTPVTPQGQIAPGVLTSATFRIDSASDAYFSYGAMFIPSNDAFIGNDDPLAFPLFDAAGNFQGVDIFLLGTNVYDAGSEVNTEIPEQTGFFGQTTPDTGLDEFGVVMMHEGFLPLALGGILADPMFSNADFTRLGYPVAQIRVSVVPIPGALLLLLSGLVGLGVARRGEGSG